MAYLTSDNPLLSHLVPRTGLETALYVFAAVSLYLVGLAIYRLYLVPQAKFPGPKLAGLTFWYEYYYDVHRKGQFTFHIVDLHKQYGPIVRINPYEVHINDPDFYGEIYHGNKWITHRDRWFNLDFIGDGLAFTLDHDLHRVRRDALSPYFSMQSIRTLEPRITAVVANMVTRLQGAFKAGEVFNMYDVGSAFAMDVITEYAFGKEGSSNMMLRPEMGKEWTEMTQNSIKMNPFARQFKWFMKTMVSIPASVMAKVNKGMELRIRWTDGMRAQVQRIIDESNADKDVKRQGKDTTMFHELLHSNLSPADKSVGRLTDEASMVVGAGGETTAQIMSRTFYHIIANPHVVEKLRKEVNEAMPDPETMPTIQELQKLPYLLAVVEEGVRISLPVPSRSPRVFQDHALKYGKWTIEPGTSISMSPYVVSTNETVFPESFTFKPERWLGNAGKELQKYAVTFSKGRRACLGKNLGYAELWYAVAVAIRRFNLELVDTTIEDVTVVHDYFMGFVKESSQGVRMKVKQELA